MVRLGLLGENIVCKSHTDHRISKLGLLGETIKAQFIISEGSKYE